MHNMRIKRCCTVVRSRAGLRPRGGAPAFCGWQLRRLTCVLIAAAALMVFVPAAHAQTTAPQACPGTFQVVNNDHIGNLSLSAGPYVITVQDPSVLSCAEASSLFTRFLEDYDGNLPKPWVYEFATHQFVGSGGQAFSVAYAGGGGGGGGGTGGLCPGTFQVLHNDSIGSFKVPAGRTTSPSRG